MMLAEPLMVYHFSGELRKPTVKVAATDKWTAMSWYARHRGLPEGSVVPPRSEVAFVPELHLNKVDIAQESFDDLASHPPTLPEKRTKSRTRYGDADPDEFPLLNHFGRGSISPEWVIDRRTGTVQIAGEFQSFPSYFLDLSEKPTVHEVRGGGGKVNPGGGLDLQAGFLMDAYPWLGLTDGEELRSALLDEIDRYERKHK